MDGNNAHPAISLEKTLMLPMVCAVTVFVTILAALPRDAPVPRRKFIYRDPFLSNMTPSEWRRTYKFARADIPILARAMHLPDIIDGGRRHRFDSVHVLTWLLYRYVGGRTFLECQEHFQRESSAISRLVDVVEDHIFRAANYSVLTFHPTLLTQARMEIYVAATRRKGCPIENVWGFIDGCKWEINRPGGNTVLQLVCYSGYVKGHCLSYHVITSPDGIIQHAFGPKAGRNNDLDVLDASGVLDYMEDHPGCFCHVLMFAYTSF